MYVCMYVCMCFIWVCIRLMEQVGVIIPTNIYVYIYIHVPIYTYLFVSIHIHTYVCMYVYKFYMCVCVFRISYLHTLLSEDLQTKY